MLLSKFKKIITTLLIVFFTATVFAATTDLAVRFLEKANEAFEDGNTDDAYKYVTALLVLQEMKSLRQMSSILPRPFTSRSLLRFSRNMMIWLLSISR